MVLVLVGGRTVTFGEGNAVLANLSAVFSAFRPGQMGGLGIAHLITGAANPSGRLAQSWVRGAGQAMSGAAPFLQQRVGKWLMNNRSKPEPDGRVYDPYSGDGTSSGVGSRSGTPLFHFGHGLSYTSFEMSNLRLSTGSNAPGTDGSRQPAAALTVQVDVANTGGLAGATVVQVYTIDPVGEYVRPWKRLLAFARVELAPAAKRTVSIPVSAAQFAMQDDSSPAGVWRAVSGEYEVRVGNSSVTDLLVDTVAMQFRE